MQISKYSASGNDFVIFHTFRKNDRSELAKILCHRQNGIGADGMVVVLPHSSHDFQWQFYNRDGSSASMCGNASRAVAHYAFENKLANSSMDFLTDAGVIHAKVDGSVVESQMPQSKKISESFEEFGKRWFFYDTGVPHLVSFVNDIEQEWDEKIFAKMRHKYNANVNIASFKDILHVRTFERGVEGETLACGTGIVASFLSAFNENKIPDKVQVIPRSKEILEVKMSKNRLFFKGEVKKVFNANFHL